MTPCGVISGPALLIPALLEAGFDYCVSSEMLQSAANPISCIFCVSNQMIGDNSSLNPLDRCHLHQERESKPSRCVSVQQTGGGGERGGR